MTTGPDIAGIRRQRCAQCRRRARPARTCRCGGVFCPRHVLPFEHTCPHDYRLEARLRIRKANPQTVAEKLERV